MVEMPVAEFEALVADALDGIPSEIGAAMENVAVVVDASSPPGRLLGLYEGVPLTSPRGPLLSDRPGSHHDLHGCDLLFFAATPKRSSRWCAGS